MKKSILLSLLIILCFCSFQFNNKSYSNELSDQDLGKIEEMLFANTYSSTSVENRLAKIEDIVYGQTFDQLPLSERMNKIKAFVPQNDNALPPRQQPQQETSQVLPERPQTNQKTMTKDMKDWLSGLPKGSVDDVLPSRNKTQFSNNSQNLPDNFNNTYNQSQNTLPPPSNHYQSHNSAPEVIVKGDSVEYPVVNNVEIELFGKNFLNEDVYKRLDRIETKLNGRTSSKSLYERVDDIRKLAAYSSVKQKYSSQYEPVIPGLNQEFGSLNTNNNHNYQPEQPERQPENNYNSYSTANSYQTQQMTENNDNYTTNTNYNPPSTNKYSSYGTGFGVVGDKLSRLEQQVFGKTYDDDLSLSRIDRLEKKVLGKTTFGLVNERIEKVDARLSGRFDTPSSAMMDKGYYFTEDGYERDTPPPANNVAQSTQHPKQFMFGGSMGSNSSRQYDNSPYNNVQPKMNVNQSMLSQMEMAVFGRAYQNMAVTARVNRLENTMFGQIYGGNMNMRMQRLLQACQNPYAAPANYGYNQGAYGQGNYGYNNYANNYYNSGVPLTRNIAGAAAGAVIDNTVGKKSGILAQIGKAAGSTLFGGPRYGYGNNYGYGNTGYGRSYYGY